MLKIIKPAQFKTIPWKNGQGETTELAINEQGNLAHFDWRLSIASVVNDGFFSNFNGYHRNLVLIEGAGLSLTHDNEKTDKLNNILDIASFSGGCKTYGELTQGSIKDFNIITNNEKILPNVHCFLKEQQVTVKLLKNSMCFAFSLTDEIVVEPLGQKNSVIAVGDLMQYSAIDNELKIEALTIKITGKNMIIVQLEMINE